MQSISQPVVTLPIVMPLTLPVAENVAEKVAEKIDDVDAEKVAENVAEKVDDKHDVVFCDINKSIKHRGEPIEELPVEEDDDDDKHDKHDKSVEQACADQLQLGIITFFLFICAGCVYVVMKHQLWRM